MNPLSSNSTECVHGTPRELRPRILVCDDEENIRQVIRQMLEREGMEIIEAQNGDRALELLRVQEFDLLLLDFMMPGMSGLELLDATRTLVPRLPVIMLSGAADKAFRRKAISRGASECLLKPFDLTELTHLVEQFATPGIQENPGINTQASDGKDTEGQRSQDSDTDKMDRHNEQK